MGNPPDAVASSLLPTLLMALIENVRVWQFVLETSGLEMLYSSCGGIKCEYELPEVWLYTLRS